jgi:hypothetical protein
VTLIVEELAMLENNDLEIKGREFVDKAYGSLAVNNLT